MASVGGRGGSDEYIEGERGAGARQQNNQAAAGQAYPGKSSVLPEVLRGYDCGQAKGTETETPTRLGADALTRKIKSIITMKTTMSQSPLKTP